MHNRWKWAAAAPVANIVICLIFGKTQGWTVNICCQNVWRKLNLFNDKISLAGKKIMIQRITYLNFSVTNPSFPHSKHLLASFLYNILKCNRFSRMFRYLVLFSYFSLSTGSQCKLIFKADFQTVCTKISRWHHRQAMWKRGKFDVDTVRTFVKLMLLLLPPFSLTLPLLLIRIQCLISHHTKTKNHSKVT